MDKEFIRELNEISASAEVFNQARKMAQEEKDRKAKEVQRKLDEKWAQETIDKIPGMLRMSASTGKRECIVFDYDDSDARSSFILQWCIDQFGYGNVSTLSREFRYSDDTPYVTHKSIQVKW